MLGPESLFNVGSGGAAFAGHGSSYKAGLLANNKDDGGLASSCSAGYGVGMTLWVAATVLVTVAAMALFRRPTDAARLEDYISADKRNGGTSSNGSEFSAARRATERPEYQPVQASADYQAAAAKERMLVAERAPAH